MVRASIPSASSKTPGRGDTSGLNPALEVVRVAAREGWLPTRGQDGIPVGRWRLSRLLPRVEILFGEGGRVDPRHKRQGRERQPHQHDPEGRRESKQHLLGRRPVEDQERE